MWNLTKKFDDFANLSVNEATRAVITYLEKQELLYKKEHYTHRYPTCWRCHNELVFRLVEEWFIDCEDIRPKLIEEANKVKWQPGYMRKRMLDWLKNMDNWCISRKRYWGLPLPFYECTECGTLTVVSSKAQLLEYSVSKNVDLPELHKPWIDEITIECPKCKSKVSRISEVGDCWLDAGIVPFSTLHYLSQRSYWNKWFPADCVCEMREQIRLWFYSQLFMGVTLTGKAPYKRVIAHEKVNDKDGDPMHRSWGNAIWFDEAVKEMGAEIMRWAYLKQKISQPMKFGFYLEKEIKPFFITLWNCYNFFATFANIDHYQPRYNLQELLQNSTLTLLDKWILSQLQNLIQSIRANMKKFGFRDAIEKCEEFIENLSTWYIRRNRNRFWTEEETMDKYAAYSTLYHCLLTLCKLLAPFVPFISEKLYQNLTKNSESKNPMSVHLNSYPKRNKLFQNPSLDAKMRTILEIVKIGRNIRNTSNIKLRQPLNEIRIFCINNQDKKTIKEFEQIILDELNIKKLIIVSSANETFTLSVKPHYDTLGPKFKQNTK
ncbi:MAG: class I tRNA ligase family protein, partial [Asgard group archaeon]|nr:class I tRNA ligase family protein [Asgard group archaeon]